MSLRVLLFVSLVAGSELFNRDATAQTAVVPEKAKVSIPLSIASAPNGTKVKLGEGNQTTTVVSDIANSKDHLVHISRNDGRIPKERQQALAALAAHDAERVKTVLAHPYNLLKYTRGSIISVTPMPASDGVQRLRVSVHLKGDGTSSAYTTDANPEIWRIEKDKLILESPGKWEQMRL